MLSCESNSSSMMSSSSPSSGKGDVYGIDSRREIGDPTVSTLFRTLGRSVALLLPQYRIEEQTEDQIKLNASSLNDRIWSSYGGPLCDDEPYIDQPAPGSCSAFLIAPNRVATAGHCVNRGLECSDMGILFDFVDSGSSTSPLTLPKSVLYKCSRVIGHHYNQGEPGTDQEQLWQDWAILELDRPVDESRLPIDLSLVSRVKLNDRVVALGYPNGVPLKYAEGQVVDDTHYDYFNTDLDIYKGNSGSPVFDQEGQFQGVVVRGSGGRSFRQSPQGCYRSRVCSSYQADPGCVGNHILYLPNHTSYQDPTLEILDYTQNVEEGWLDENWEDHLEVVMNDLPLGKQVAWVTLNIDANSSDPSVFLFELQHQNQTYMLADQPKYFKSGRAQWSRTSFDFTGQDPKGVWILKIKQQRYTWTSSLILKWQILIGVVDQRN